MKKELRFNIYQAMLDILEGAVKINNGECDNVCVDVNNHSFFLVRIYDIVCCKFEIGDDTFIYGFCSILDILRKVIPELSEYNAASTILMKLDELQPYSRPSGYWFDPLNRKSRIDLLKTVIKIINHDTD